MVNTFNAATKYATLFVNCASDLIDVTFIKNNVETTQLSTVIPRTIDAIQNTYPVQICKTAIKHQAQKMLPEIETLSLKLALSKIKNARLLKNTSVTDSIFSTKNIILLAGSTSAVTAGVEAVRSFRKEEYLDGAI